MTERASDWLDITAETEEIQKRTYIYFIDSQVINLEHGSKRATAELTLHSCSKLEQSTWTSERKRSYVMELHLGLNKNKTDTRLWCMTVWSVIKFLDPDVAVELVCFLETQASWSRRGDLQHLKLTLVFPLQGCTRPKIRGVCATRPLWIVAHHSYTVLDHSWTVMRLALGEIGPWYC